jgi:hypothetical protein
MLSRSHDEFIYHVVLWGNALAMQFHITYCLLYVLVMHDPLITLLVIETHGCSSVVKSIQLCIRASLAVACNLALYTRVEGLAAS